MQAIYEWPTWIPVVGLLALMFAANEVGYRAGRRWDSAESDRSHTIRNALKASVIGLVALLLGFSFAMTTNRFSERQHIVLDEANAIGTCDLRAGLLAEPARSEIRDALMQYTEARLEHFETGLNPDDFERTTRTMDAAMIQLWSGIETAVTADRELARLSLIVPAANQVIDLSATRAWASHNQTPPLVILLLAVCAIVSSGLVGHSSGQAAMRHTGLWFALNILVILVIFVVLDFDRPRRGLIQVNHTPLIELRESMGRHVQR